MAQVQKQEFIETLEREISSLSENINNLIHSATFIVDKDEWSSSKDQVKLQVSNENIKNSLSNLLQLTNDLKNYLYCNPL